MKRYVVLQLTPSLYGQWEPGELLWLPARGHTFRIVGRAQNRYLVRRLGDIDPPHVD